MYVKIHGKRRGTVQDVTFEAIDSPLYIRKWLNVHPDNTNIDAPLFVSFSDRNYGKRMHIDYPWFLLKKLGKRAKLGKKVKPHLLRHSKATDLIKKGFVGKHLMKAMRHSTLEMQSRYLYLCNEEVDNARVKAETGLDRHQTKHKKVLTSITCPKCGVACEPTAIYCQCGYALNPTASTLETMVSEVVTKLIKENFSQFINEESQVAQEQGELPNIELLTVKCQEAMQTSAQVGRKQVKTVPSP